MSSSRHYCTVCHAWYRSWAMHAGSVKHMTKLRQAANPGGSKKRGRGGTTRTTRRTMRQGDDMVKVDDYFRNPPTPPWPASIRARVHYVRDYWRQMPNGRINSRVVALRKSLAKPRARRTAHR